MEVKSESMNWWERENVVWDRSLLTAIYITIWDSSEQLFGRSLIHSAGQPSHDDVFASIDDVEVFRKI